MARVRGALDFAIARHGALLALARNRGERPPMAGRSPVRREECLPREPTLTVSWQCFTITQVQIGANLWQM